MKSNCPICKTPIHTIEMGEEHVHEPICPTQLLKELIHHWKTETRNPGLTKANKNTLKECMLQLSSAIDGVRIW